MRARSIPLAGILATLALACSGSNTAATFSPQYTPVIPTSWTANVTNPYFPLTPGATWQYRAQTSKGVETITVEVLPGKQTVNGIAATAIRDRVYLGGTLLEDTFDWYAQDGDGNVWYVGEATKEYQNGVVVSTEGSWEWGVDGALPGIQMWANPAAKIGIEYRQEYYKGQAEDWGKVIGAGEAAVVPFGNFANCITIEEWVGLDPGEPHDTKQYCPGVGNVSGGRPGASDREVLISRAP